MIPVLPTTSARQNTTSKDLPQREVNNVSDHSKTDNNAKGKGTRETVLETKADAIPSTSSRVIKDKTTSATIKSQDRKQRPRKLDIAAAKEDSKKPIGIENASTDGAQTVKGKAEPSQPSTPATAVSQMSTVSAVPQNQAREARAPMIPKAESASPGIVSSKQASRRPSLSSINRPGTPASEKLFDTMSFTSTSISRANSPPPNKVGSAPVRQMTKSQQKKERQARAKQAEGSTKVEETVTKFEEIQAPIVGRKKKTRKEKSRGTADSTPTVTRPSSPVLQEEPAVEKAAVVPATPVKEGRKGSSKAVADVKEPDTPSSPATPATADQPKPSLTANSIFANLSKAREVTTPAADIFKHAPQGLNHRSENVEPDFPEFELPSDEQIRLLDQGEAVPIQKGPNNYLVVLPDHRHVPGFTAAQASRYIELRRDILANGDLPCTDGFIPPPPPIELSAITAMTERSSKTKKLHNRFDTPTTRSGSSTHKYNISTGVSDETTLNKKPAIAVTEAEQMLAVHRKETEALEKRLNNLLKKNRRLLFGNTH